MSMQHEPLDPDFIQRQRQRLEILKSELQSSREFHQDDELRIQSTRMNENHASGGDAQRHALQDNNRAVGAHDRMRLETVRRALEKIDDGSYGRSDQSGDQIRRERLEALPASLYTLEEEEVRERERGQNP